MSDQILQHNGPSVDCYGLSGDAKRNYEQGGYCYESSMPAVFRDRNGNILDKNGNVLKDEVVFNSDGSIKTSMIDKVRIEPEQRWHAVQHTLGVDFSNEDFGGTVLT